MKTYEYVRLCRTPFLKRMLGYPGQYLYIETVLADGTRTVVGSRTVYV